MKLTSMKSLFALLSLIVALLLLGVTGLVAAQVPGSSEPKTDRPLSATMQLENVRLRGDVESLLAQLALQCDIPIGFERAMNDAAIRERRMNFKQITLDDVLTQVLAEYKQYSWEIRDGVVYVFPKEGYRDPIIERFLNVEIKSFSLGKATLTYDVEAKLLKTRELEEVVDAYGLRTRSGYTLSGFFFPQLGRNFTLDVSNTTVGTILNRIVKESPVAKFWSISRNSNSHMLFIDLDTSHEDTPKQFRRPVDFEELELLSYPIP